MLKEFLKYVKSKRYVMLVLVLVMVVVYYFGTFFYMSTMKNINVGGLLIWKSHISADFSDEKVQLIKDEYGADNVTLISTPHVIEYTQINAVESTFINNGVHVDHPKYWQLVENIELLKGEIWDTGTTEKVIVIDEATAERLFGNTNVVNQYFDIEGEKWKIIGIVSNTSERMELYQQYIQEHEEIVTPEDFDTEVYIPYYYRDYELFHSSSEEPTSIIVNTGNLISTKKDEQMVLDLILEGENLMQIDEDMEVAIVSVASSSSYDLHNIEGYIITLLIPLFILLSTYNISLYKEKGKVLLRKYRDTDQNSILSLKVQDHQKQFIRTTSEVLRISQGKDDCTTLYVIEYKGNVIGVCLIKLEKQYNNSFIWQFIIDKEFQGLGFGKKALRKIIRDLEKSSYSITTTTKMNNTVARTFFEKNGFTITSEEVDEYNYKYKV